MQNSKINNPIKPVAFDFALEIGFLPGVTDNVATTTQQIIADLLKRPFKDGESVHSSQVYYFTGEITKEDVTKIATLKSNTLIHHVAVKDFTTFQKDHGMDKLNPKVTLHPTQTLRVDLDLSEADLKKLGKEGIKDKQGRRGPLALELDYLKAIRDYFQKEKRKPTDVELESIAQTWSEHCKHTIFSSTLDEVEDGLYKGLIKRATNEIRQKKGKNDFCVSVFTDNAGGIVFDDDWVITDKAETHNSPSALDPFGGAITGIVGVNRDCLGFGLGAKPILNRYGFCFADPHRQNDLYRAKNKKDPALSPRRIMDGVIEGVNAGGNCSGIPTPQGFMVFHDDYRGKPLVFVGTVGLIPREIHGQPSWKKGALAGDKIVMVGGRVGQDGIHGATFSSGALDEESPATAVQIGDPITQKKLSDTIIKEARERGLYNSITDNGAGGLSCSVAEMAREAGGALVNLDLVPLKYPNLDPWKIWISESQERMTLAVPPEKVTALLALLKKREVEATVIGEFTSNGRCVVQYKGEKVMDVDLHFLHEGLPQRTLKSVYKRKHHADPSFPHPKRMGEMLLKMLGRLNICSREFVATQYDHEVQGGSVIKPLQGKGRVNGEATAVRPVLSSNRAVVVSQGLHPRYSAIDPYAMAACSIDTAIRNAVSIGGNIDHMALMDNFCWCSSDTKQRLGELKAAVQACYDYAVEYGTPFISGKDSMFNDFNGYDAKGNRVKVSAPPTLMISSLSVTEDATKCLTLDLKVPGDLIYILGITKNELGGSEYFALHDTVGSSVPQVDQVHAQIRYRTFYQAIKKELMTAAISVNLGGVGVALAKMAMAGQLGLTVDVRKIPSLGMGRDDYLLFSESQSRLIVTVDPQKREIFEALFGQDAALIGLVTERPIVDIMGLHGDTIIDLSVPTLDQAYRETFKNF